MATRAISAQGSRLYISTAPYTGSPTQFVAISEVKNFSRDGDRPEIDVSNLDSEAREYLLGLKDNGTLGFECNAVFADAGQLKVLEALDSPYAYDFKLVYPDGTTDYFRALVKQFNIKGGVDEAVMRSGQLRVTGAITTA